MDESPACTDATVPASCPSVVASVLKLDVSCWICDVIGAIAVCTVDIRAVCMSTVVWVFCVLLHRPFTVHGVLPPLISATSPLKVEFIEFCGSIGMIKVQRDINR